VAPEEDLRVENTSTVVVALGPIALELPPSARRLARNGRIQLTFVPVPVAEDQGAVAFAEHEVATPFEVQVDDGRLVVPASEGEVGRFRATPADAGEEDLFLWLKDARINGQEVDYPFYVLVGDVEVGGPGVGTTIEDWLLRLGAVALAIAAIVALFKWVPPLVRRLRGS
jgi:hypothetical protein